MLDGKLGLSVCRQIAPKGVRVFVWALFLALVICGAGDAFAQSSSDRQLSPDKQVFDMINAGRFEAAQDLLDTQSPSKADRLFFSGRVLKVQGHLPEAIDTFRQVLVLDPQYIKARRELGHTMLLAGQYDVAEFQFDELLRIDPNTEEHPAYEHFLNIIGQNKPLGFNAFVALVPSTNINRGTTNATFDTANGVYVINATSKASSGVGKQMGFSGFARRNLSPTSRATLAYSVEGTRYNDSIYNYVTGTVSLSYEKRLESGHWSISPYLRVMQRKDQADYTALGLRFDTLRRVSSKNHIKLSLGHEARRYPDQTYNDGGYTTAVISAGRQITPAFSTTGGLALERGNPQAAHLQYLGYRIFAGVSKSWAGGLNTGVGLSLGARKFSGDFPLTTTPRSDRFAGINFTVSNARFRIKGFSPRLACSYTVNTSNVAFYDYDTTECQATISKNF